jgi:hydrogenase maturation factor
VEEIFSQVSEACGELGVALCGGHTEITQGLDRPIVVGQMLGEVEEAKLVSPDKIRLGDDVLLTKGIAIEGTALIAREKPELASVLGNDQVERCRALLDKPGISVVREARTAGGVARIHAMHDPTEGGLASGLRELAEAAGMGMRAEMDKIPVFPETAILCRKLNLDPLGLLASGALLIVAAGEDSPMIIDALAREGIPAAVIGRVWEREKGIKLVKRGRTIEMPSFERDEVARLFGGKGR